MSEEPCPTAQEDLEKEHDFDEKKESKTEDEAPGLSFDPPVYRQRYSVVYQMVNKYNAKKVLDFGCAECKLLRFLISNETSIEHLVGVDIDGDLLQQSKFRIEPLIADYLHPKQVPFTVSMLQGSISQADDRFCNFDLISCVEIIEHLVPEHLEAMPEVLFGKLSPKIAIVTTPNADFNILFPNLKGFRHWDHKFEWTRAEFEEWATVQANKYGYNVSFQGIGHGPIGTEHLGCCSQMALFEKDESINLPKETQSFGQPYQLIKEVDFPYRKSTITEEDKILYEVERLLWLWSQPNPYEEELDDKSSEDDSPKSFKLIHLFEMQGLKKLCGTMERLQSVLKSSRFQLTDDGTSILWCHPEWESDGSEGSLDWSIDTKDDTGISSSNQDDKEPENWDLDVDDADVNNRDICWNTADDNDGSKYWDGATYTKSEDVLTEDTNTENDDDNACSEEDIPFDYKLSWRVVKNYDDDDDDGQDTTVGNDSTFNQDDDDDDGLIWMASDEPNTLSNNGTT